MSDEGRKPRSYDEMFPGRFLKAGLLLGKEHTLTISDVRIVALEGDKGVQDRAIVSFDGASRGMVLNRTNAECLRAMFGSDVGAWTGKRVTIYPTRDRFGSEEVDAIRIRGSPDLAAPVTAVVRLPKRKPKSIALVKT